jgi:predicted DNA-binding protein YlxM (UPF0122 family)
MEKIVERTMLYDFYGELLTEHQRRVYESVVFQDLTLSEAAEIEGISRQGVHDLIRRCDRLLDGYEQKLHLIARFLQVKHSVRELHEQMLQYAESRGEALPSEIEESCNRLLEEL